MKADGPEIYVNTDGKGFLFFGFFLLLMFGLGISEIYRNDLPLFVGFLMTVVIGGPMILCLAQAYILYRNRPIGLKIDRTGLSGYVLDWPLRWSDVVSFGLVRYGEDDHVCIALNEDGRRRIVRPKEIRSERWSDKTIYHVRIDGTVLDIKSEELLDILRAAKTRYEGEQADVSGVDDQPISS